MKQEILMARLLRALAGKTQEAMSQENVEGIGRGAIFSMKAIDRPKAPEARVIMTWS